MIYGRANIAIRNKNITNRNIVKRAGFAGIAAGFFKTGT
jgi:hypothetical protein